MKTAREVFDRAMQLCSYTNQNGSVDGVQSAELLKRGLAFINQIYADLSFTERQDDDISPILSMSEEIPLSARSVNDVMPYGVAMLLAQADGDAMNQSLYAEIYNQKRRVAQKFQRTILDTMPTGEW
jgi:hypothetical protein